MSLGLGDEIGAGHEKLPHLLEFGATALQWTTDWFLAVLSFFVFNRSVRSARLPVPANSLTTDTRPEEPTTTTSSKLGIPVAPRLVRSIH